MYICIYIIEKFLNRDCCFFNIFDKELLPAPETLETSQIWEISEIAQKIAQNICAILKIAQKTPQKASECFLKV